MPQTPERKKIQQREYCARPEVKAKRAASHAAWMEKNKDKKQAAEARRRLERRASCLIAKETGRDRMRVVDGRLQALRKAGKIRHVKASINGRGGWEALP